MRNLKVKDLMTPDPVLISPDATLQEAAREMSVFDCGFLPVIRKDGVLGTITDRDITIRAVSAGLDPKKEKVLNYMTHECFACNEDDYLEDAAEKMREHKVSRLVVKNHKGEVTGVLSFGGILRQNADAREVSNVVKHATRREVA